MKVTLKTTMAGPAGGGAAGQTIDVPQAQAYDLIERGYAEQPPEPAKERAELVPAVEVEPVETASVESSETTTSRAQKRTRRRAH